MSTDISLEFGKACEDLSWNPCTCLPHRSETNGIAEKSGTENKRRDDCSIVAINFGWKMVGCFYGMLSLSAKCPRPPGIWEKHRMNGDLEIHLKAGSLRLAQW